MSLKTSVCDLLGIDVPIFQGPFGPWPVIELAAAVSNAGGLGSLGTALRSVAQLQDDISQVRERTKRPFVVNHTRRPFHEDLFAATLAAQPPIISMALGESDDLVQRAHDVGSLFMQQVTTVRQAVQAAEQGVDVIIAQGSEAGGFGGTVSLFALLPQVVDAVSPIPVIASGGIADGRGMAAAFILGAQGVNIGTRFLASTEAAIAAEWKEKIIAAESEDAVKIAFANAVFPPPSPGGYDSSPRSLRSDFVDRGHALGANFEQAAAQFRIEMAAAIEANRIHELAPLAGQTVGLIHDIRPAAMIMAQMVAEAEAALGRVPVG